MRLSITKCFSLFLSYYFFVYLKMRQHLERGLLFGLIGHFGLLKEVNISFFLSACRTVRSDEHVLGNWKNEKSKLLPRR